MASSQITSSVSTSASGELSKAKPGRLPREMPRLLIYFRRIAIVSAKSRKPNRFAAATEDTLESNVRY